MAAAGTVALHTQGAEILLNEMEDFGVVLCECVTEEMGCLSNGVEVPCYSGPCYSGPDGESPTGICYIVDASTCPSAIDSSTYPGASYVSVSSDAKCADDDPGSFCASVDATASVHLIPRLFLGLYAGAAVAEAEAYVMLEVDLSLEGAIAFQAGSGQGQGACSGDGGAFAPVSACTQVGSCSVLEACFVVGFTPASLPR